VLHEKLQKEGITNRWRINGMRPDDVAIIGDADETFTRDFLRALQICDVPQFRKNQSCHSPKLIASTLVMESSSECITKGRRWYHPDTILGECVDLIGNTTLHPSALREWSKNDKNEAASAGLIKAQSSKHGSRLRGYGKGGNYSLYEADGRYPLWTAEDIRTESGGRQFVMKDNSPTGYHFHNFFTSAHEIHFKYFSYSHSSKEAMSTPLWEMADDLDLGVRCAKGEHRADDDIESFDNATGKFRPIYYLNEEVRRMRHLTWQNIVREEEGKYARNAQSSTIDELTNGINEVLENKEQEDEGPVHENFSNSDWDSSKSVVMGLASGYGLNVYEQFVGSLRATGYPGHIILGISKDAGPDVLQYLKKHNVTVHEIEKADVCTYNGTIGDKGDPVDMKRWHCPKAYPDYKITWARFLFYRDWLNDCPLCTDGVILTDVRDAFFQRDPFTTAVKLNQQHPLMLFEEIPALDNTHWLTDFPVMSCRNYKVGTTRVLCSGSIMGSREGIFDYLKAMATEFDYWKTRDNCRIDMPGDDQSIHNYLFYAKKLKNAVSIPHRTGPIHVVGYQAARIYENATKEAQDRGIELNNVGDFYVKDKKWQEWLPQKFDLIDPSTGLIVNLNGEPSAQVHQVDRFGSLNRQWINKMTEKDWPYNSHR